MKETGTGRRGGGPQMGYGGHGTAARARVGESDALQESALRVSIGAGLVAASLVLFLAAVNRGLTALLADAVGTGTAQWLSPLILALGVALLAWSMVRSATASIREDGYGGRQAA